MVSYAEFRACAYKRQIGQAWTVDGMAPSSAAISNNTYTLTRFIYHVTKKVDVDRPTPAGTEALGGADGGKGWCGA